MIFIIQLSSFAKGFKKKFKSGSALLISLLISACAQLPSEQASNISSEVLKPAIVSAYGADNVNSTQDKHDAVLLDSLPNKQAFVDGLGNNNNAELNLAIQQALSTHPTIIENQAKVEQAIQQIAITKADQFLNLSLAGSVSKETSAQSDSPSSSSNLNLSASLPLDVWGNLSSASQAAHYQLAVARANLAYSKHKLIADITKAWYQLLYSEKYFKLFEKQQQNTSAQLATIEYSYQNGLIDALDVYLARENAQTARANLISRQQDLENASRNLQLLLYAYPNGALTVDSPLPVIEQYAQEKIGVPADLLANRSDLNSRWLAVLAQDASVASLYAQQFPQFSLTGNLSLTSSRLSELFKENLLWSLASSVSQTIFDNGRKSALHKQSQAKLVEQEQLYLLALQDAFREVETLLSNEKSIREQWRLTQQALRNTSHAFEQVNIQYQNGIANYQQVLDIQERLFSQEQTELEQQMSLINNRVDLILALGNSDKTTK